MGADISTGVDQGSARKLEASKTEPEVVYIKEPCVCADGMTRYTQGTPVWVFLLMGLLFIGLIISVIITIQTKRSMPPEVPQSIT